MSNIISSDFYRMRKGAALRNTFLGMAILIIFLLVTITVLESKDFSTTMADNTGNMSAADLAEMEQDFADMQQDTGTLTNGGDFAKEMLMQSFFLFFFLPIALAVFCADFTVGTYRNTLSYESNRTRVYLAKLLLSALLSFVLVISAVLLSLLSGGIVLGFGGLTAAFFTSIITTILLQTPLLLATIAVCHCLIAVTKKSSITITVFIVGVLALSILLQVLSSNLPSLEWLMLLDPQGGGKIMAQHEFVPTAQLLFVGGYNLLVAAIATTIGILHYRKTDMP